MQQHLHPTYGPVAFRDRSTGTVLVTRSTLAGRTDLASIRVGDTRYPLVDVDVTSDSHPFWTGRTRTLDAEGRVEKFERRYGRTS